MATIGALLCSVYKILLTYKCLWKVPWNKQTKLSFCYCSSLSSLTAGEVTKAVVTAVTEHPALFDFILRDITSGQQDIQMTALQMLAAGLHCDTLTG